MKIYTILVTVLLLCISGLTFAQTTTAPPVATTVPAKTPVNKDTSALIDQLKTAYTAGDLIQATTLTAKITSQLAIETQLAKAKNSAAIAITSPAILQVDEGIIAEISYPDITGYILKEGGQSAKICVTIPDAQNFNDKLLSINGKNYPISYTLINNQIDRISDNGALMIMQPGTCRVKITIGIKSVTVPITTIGLPFGMQDEEAQVVMLWGVPENRVYDKYGVSEIWTWDKYPGLKVEMFNHKVFGISFGWEKWRGY